MTAPSRTVRRRPFLQLDVFADAPQRGNPLAVVLEADGLSDAEMQRIAQWTNLSETTFLLAPTTAGADYRVRIWTPSGELPFAGHPTLGTARAWLHAGGAPTGERIVQECGVGLVEVRCPGIGAEAGSQLAFAAPPLLREGPLEEGEVDAIAAALGVDRGAVRGHTWADNGPGWQVVELEDAAQVLALTPDVIALGERKLGVMGRHDGAGERAAQSGTRPVGSAQQEYACRPRRAAWRCGSPCRWRRWRRWRRWCRWCRWSGRSGPERGCRSGTGLRCR